MFSGLRTGLAATALFGVLAIGSQAYAAFPEIEHFDNDTDTWTPGSDPNYDFNNDPTLDGMWPKTAYDEEGVPEAEEIEFGEIRNGAGDGVIEEVPSGFAGITASHGANMGFVQLGGDGGVMGAPSRQIAPLGTPFSFQVDIYTDPSIEPSHPGDQGNNNPDFWWTNAVGNNTDGDYLTEGGLTGEILHPAGGDKFWRFTTTILNQNDELPNVDIPLNTWITLETLYHENPGGKVGITYRIWNHAHDQVLYDYSLTPAQIFLEPDWADMGGPHYSWFTLPEPNLKRLFVDNMGVAPPIEIEVDFVLGDMDGDGDLDNFDIQPFELALTDEALWESTYGLDDAQDRGDIDNDGDLDNFDIQPFETLLTSGGLASATAAVPEPSALALAALGLLGLVMARRRQHS